MNDHDENDIHLRDQFAIAAMQSLIGNQKLYGSFIDDDEMCVNSLGKAERIAIASYKMADAMRKARLASFK